MSQKSIQICRKMPRFHPHWKPCMQNLHGDVWMAPGRPLNEFGGKTNRTRWWFQIFLIFTPNFGEDSHFDSYFSKGLKKPATREKLGSLPICVFLNSFFEDVEDKKHWNPLEPTLNFSILHSPQISQNDVFPPKKCLISYMSTGLCLLLATRSQVLALKKEPRIDCALVFLLDKGGWLLWGLIGVSCFVGVGPVCLKKHVSVIGLVWCWFFWHRTCGIFLFV